MSFSGVAMPRLIFSWRVTNNRRKLPVALGGVMRAVPLVLKKSDGYAPKKDWVVCAFTLLVAVWAALTMTTATAADLEAAGMVKTSR